MSADNNVIVIVIVIHLIIEAITYEIVIVDDKI